MLWLVFLLQLGALFVHLGLFTTPFRSRVRDVPPARLDEAPRASASPPPPPPQPPPPREQSSAAGERDVNAAAPLAAATDGGGAKNNASSAPLTPTSCPSGVPRLSRVRGYWTYEVCLGHHIAQYHESSNGVDWQRSTSLGRYDAALDDRPQSRPRSQRYTFGDACGQRRTSPRRQTALLISCGSRDRIVSVNEPHPCRYVIVATLLSACPPAPPAETT